MTTADLRHSGIVIDSFQHGSGNSLIRIVTNSLLGLIKRSDRSNMDHGVTWISQFPPLAGLGERERKAIASASVVADLPAGARVFEPGQPAERYLLVLAGSVRVQQVSESGRSIVLYRVAAGEACALTTACLIGGDLYNAEAIAETPVTAVVMARAAFGELMETSTGFRKFVFRSFGGRLSDLFRLVEEVAFARMDIRLAHKLIELSEGGGEVAATQAELAAELGTAREVVSRMLGEFQRRTWVAAGRGTIQILDRAALCALAATAV